MRILVTGAAGFVASHLAERLANIGHDVIGVDCFTDYYPRELKERNAADVRASGARVLELDLAADDLGPAFEGVEAVYHLAAQPGISADTSFDDYLRNNVVATERLLEAAAACQSLSIFTNVSTSSVYGLRATDPETAPPRPASHYGVTKLAAEAMALAYHEAGRLQAVSFRLFSVYGPRERPEKLFPRLIRAILEDEPFPLYAGAREHSRSFTFARDIVDGLLTAVERPAACAGEVFNIGSDEEFRTMDGIRIVEEIVGRKARAEDVAGRPGDQIRTAANIDKIRRELSYAPRVTLEEGLRETVAWFENQLQAEKQDAAKS